MGILLDKNTKVLVQAITGREGSFHSSLMLEYGTNIVAGVTPGKEGQKVHGVPVFGDVASAVGQTGAEASVMFVPARFTKTAVEEAIAAGIKLVVIITEGIPTQDMIEVVNKAKAAGVIIIGPNCPGLATVGQAKMGIIPAEIFLKGKIN